MTETTRSKSPKKPADHKPAKDHTINIQFAGEKYEFDVRAASDTRTMFALRKEDLETVLIRVIGKDGLDRAIKSIEDEDGFSDIEKLLDFVNAIYEKVGAKNS